MDIKDIINKLENIEKKSQLFENVLSLQAVQAIERTAQVNAKRVKDTGSAWEKFTGWDPKTAGNVALAKLAQEHNLNGLFNSEGEYVPPTPDDWNPLAKLGLIPHNAQGPAGLTNFLSGGGAGKEFDAAKSSSASVEQPDDLALDDNEEQVPDESPQGAKMSDSDETEAKKLADVNDLVNQFLSQKKAAEVVKEGYLEDSLSMQLIESFGYIPEAVDLSKPSFGNPNIAAQGAKGRANMQAQQATSKAGLSWGDGDGVYTWDDPIITTPDGTVIYAFRDLAFDLGISIVAIGIGTLTAVPTGGVSEAAAAGVVGTRLVRVAKVIKMWWAAFKSPMTVFKDVAAAKLAISTFAKTQLNAFKASVIKALRAMPTIVATNAGINWFISWLGDVLPDDVKDKLMAGVAAVASKIPMPVRQGAADFGDWVGDKFGVSNDK